MRQKNLDLRRSRLGEDLASDVLRGAELVVCCLFSDWVSALLGAVTSVFSASLHSIMHACNEKKRELLTEPRAALISVSLSSQPDTSSHHQTTDTEPSSKFQCGAGQPVPPCRLRPPCGPISHPQKVPSNYTGY